VNQHVCIIRTDPTIDPAFLSYFLASPEFQRFIVNTEAGATRQALTKGQIEDFQVPRPPLPEQRRIAGQLEQADRLRRTRRYALELTDTFLPAAFLKLFGDPTTNPLGLPVAELGDFLSFVTSGSRGWAEHYVPEGSRFIRSLDVRMNNISDEDAVFVKPPNNAEADRTRVKPADVLLTITGSRIGRVAPVPERLSGAFISQHVAILRLKAGLLPEFLSMFLSLDTGGPRQIARAQYGQTKPGLNLNQIREMRVPVPDVCHQQRFLKLAKRVERLRAVQREALRQAEHLFASLLHCAFSG
jgi:type I restriction enzyme S subunit